MSHTEYGYTDSNYVPGKKLEELRKDYKELQQQRNKLRDGLKEVLHLEKLGNYYAHLTELIKECEGGDK